MRTLLLLAVLWGAFSWVAVRQWRADRAGARRDEQVRRLLSGALVPVPRVSPDNADESAVTA